MINIKKILLTPWAVGIGSAVISSIILKIIDITAGTKMLSKLLGFFRSLLELKVSFGLIFIIGFTIWIIRIFLKSHSNQKKAKTNLPFINYKKDVFQDILYKWKYDFVNGKCCVGKTQAYCPNCKCRIVNRTCLICKSLFLKIFEKEEIKAVIAYSIEKKFRIDEFNELGR